MDFKQIEAFINVAKFKSFSKAANSSFLSQPAISSHIASLEKELSVQLFDRTSKEVLLTPAGESFLKYALDILNTRDKAIFNLANFNEKISGKLRLSASTTPCNTIVPSLIKEFHKEYPDVSFDVTEQSSGQVIESITKFDCELGLVGELINDEKIKSYTIIDDDLVIISPPQFNFPDTIDIDFLFKYKFILREQGSATRKTFEEALKKQGIDFSNIDVHFEVNNLDTLYQFVKSGLGVSIVSKYVLRDYISLGFIKESTIKKLSLKRYIYLVTSCKRTLTPTAKAFFNLCKNHYKF
ncbi:selenium metabolism-associated LysR family transcriptional regulator [Clostridium magnum]|uniref:HTH-type transcriptional regulator CysL n=1 Tax=Clostridium magnum DSM 2767 TaxID=1121326 RepID=A0A162TU63_9CLOT|nr:selenium metabolism-associated LysR family transcriptional regulator [Clostridium magnum]KZL93070.1 HTH-type transcriptional regulator CysL [Clostridium magnum DSM 2767]SHI72920.1 DNA-binding transcriptional regulator, LysR family [Clostridium magnum DSM 2767]